MRNKSSNRTVSPPGRSKPLWQIRLARIARKLHKWIGVSLALAMVVVSVTGGFVAWKKQVEYLQPASRPGSTMALDQMISPEAVAERVLSLGLPHARELDQIDRIELRPSKGMYKVRLEQHSSWRSPLELQVDALTGEILNQGVRGDQLWMDLHSFAVFGEVTKLVIMTLAGLSLLWLSLSGLYLFGFPPWYRARKRRITGH